MTRALATAVVDATALDVFGWRIPIGLYRVLRLSAVFAVGLVAMIGWGMVASMLIASIGQVGTVLLSALITGYAGFGAAFRIALTARRDALVAHPAAAFFRALDVHRLDVLMAEAGMWIAFPTALSAGVGAGTLVELVRSGTASSMLFVTLLLLPVSVCLGLAAITARITACGKLEHAPGILTVAVGALASVIAGVVAAWLGLPLIVDRAAPLSLTAVSDLPAAVLPVLIAVLTAACALSAVLVARHVQVLRDRSWRILATRARPMRYRASRRWVDMAWLLVRGSPQRVAVGRIVLVTWMLAGFGGGVAAALPAELPGVVDTVSRAAVLVALVAGLSMSEAVARRAGPVALAPLWRWAWEQGAPAGRLGAATLTVAALAGVTLGAPLAIVVAVAGGPALSPVSVAVACTAGAALASAVTRTDRLQPDGSATASLATALLGVVVTVPTAVIAFTLPALGGAAACASALVTMIGAHLCIRRRVLRLPSAAAA